MEENNEKTIYGIKGFLKYISTVVSWTMFVLLVLLGILLIYYFISVKLFALKGEKYEPFFSIYSVQSGSMEPTISYKDVIINLKADIDDVKVNDVITFISAWQVNYGMTMTHRVVAIQTMDDGSTCLVTRGDSNTNDDQVCVTEENLIGIVKAVLPGFGKVKDFLSSFLGWLLIIIIPALYVIVKDIIKLFNIEDKVERKKNNKQKAIIEKIEKKENTKDKKSDQEFLELLSNVNKNTEEKVDKKKEESHKVQKDQDQELFELLSTLKRKDERKIDKKEFDNKIDLNKQDKELVLNDVKDEKTKEEKIEKKREQEFFNLLSNIKEEEDNNSISAEDLERIEKAYRDFENVRKK